MKRMQFIKGWRDLILLVALVQLTFMCPLCLGVNDTVAATNDTDAAANGTVDATTDATGPATGKKFVCTLTDTLNAAAGDVTKVEVTVNGTTTKSYKNTTFAIVDKEITVEGLTDCDGINENDKCTVTYKEENDTKTADGTGECKDADPVATVTESGSTAGPADNATSGATTAAATAGVVTTTTTKAATTKRNKKKRPTKKPSSDDKKKDDGSSTMIIVIVVIVAAIVAIAALLFFIKKKKPALWAKLKGKCSSCKEKKPFNKCFKKKKGPTTTSATAVSEVPSSKSALNATASQTGRKSTVKSPTRKSTVRSPTRKATVADGGADASADQMSNEASSQQGSETASQRSGSVVSDGTGSDKASATGSGGSDKSRGSMSERGSIVSEM